MKQIQITVEFKDHDKVILSNPQGDTYTSKSEELMDFLHGAKPIVSSSLPPMAEIYSFVQWIASEDFDWHYSETAELWMKDGWCSRTTAELLEFWSRRQ